MRSGFRLGSASSMAAMPVRCAPSAPRTRDQFDMTVEQQRRAAVLDHRRERLDARDHGALVGRLQPQQHRGDIGAGEHAGKACHQRRRIVHVGRCEIKPWRGARRSGFGGHDVASAVDLTFASASPRVLVSECQIQSRTRILSVAGVAVGANIRNRRGLQRMQWRRPSAPGLRPKKGRDRARRLESHATFGSSSPLA